MSKKATTRTDTSQKANKHDDSKASRPELIAPEFTYLMGEVLAMGAKKYSAGNWARGMEWSRLYGATQRHLLAWASGEELDSESGLPHLGHAAFGIMCLVAYSKRGVGIDDRVTVGMRHK